ncbi:MAG: thioredoxin domain-containing protein, partial [Gammaproteobacteria bacterium]
RGVPEETAEWHRAASLLYTPGRLVYAIPAGQPLPEPLAAKTGGDSPVAYVCRGTVCSSPVTSLSDLASELRASS